MQANFTVGDNLVQNWTYNCQQMDAYELLFIG